MAILWFEGFDRYGTTISNMTDRLWSSVDATGLVLATENPKSGAYSLRVDSTTANKGAAYRGFGYLAGLTEVIVGGSFYLSNLPTANNRLFLFAFLDINTDIQMNVQVTTTGAIRISGNSRTSTIVDSDDVYIRPGSYHHIECKLFVATGSPNGRIEVRVDGQIAVIWDGDTDTRGTGEVSYLRVGQIDGVGNESGVDNMYVDALYALDLIGPDNNDFIGDKSVYTLFPDSDQSLNGWSWPNLGTVSAYTTCNEAAPDDDADYTFANVGGSPIDTVTFGLDNLPSTQTNINGIMVVNRTKVEDSVSPSIDAQLQTVVESGVSELGGDFFVLDGFYGYYFDILETDPDSGVAFTTSDINGLTTRLERAV